MNYLLNSQLVMVIAWSDLLRLHWPQSQPCGKSYCVEATGRYHLWLIGVQYMVVFFLNRVRSVNFLHRVAELKSADIVILLL